jgi:hypothetical protein
MAAHKDMNFVLALLLVKQNRGECVLLVEAEAADVSEKKQ